MRKIALKTLFWVKREREEWRIIIRLTIMLQFKKHCIRKCKGESKIFKNEKNIWTQRNIYHTTSISAHAYYSGFVLTERAYHSAVCSLLDLFVRSIFSTFLKKQPSDFEQFLEILGIFEQGNLDLK